MITQLLRRVERFTKKKQKNAIKTLKRNVKKMSKRFHKVNKRYLEKFIANSMAIKMVGYVAMFMVVTAGYEPAVSQRAFASQLKLDTTKSTVVSLPSNSIDIKVTPAPAPVVSQPVATTTASTEARATVARERATKPVVKQPAPAPAVTVPTGTIQTYAQTRSDQIFGAGHFSALVSLWNHESGWNYKAYNASSGACGIPQALPCSKGGANFRNDPYKQVEWGLNYIRSRYGNPTNALKFWNSHRWY